MAGRDATGGELGSPTAGSSEDIRVKVGVGESED